MPLNDKNKGADENFIFGIFLLDTYFSRTIF